MAQKLITTFHSDLSDEEAAVTVSFIDPVGGRVKEIDLSEEEAATFVNFFSTYAKAARTVSDTRQYPVRALVTQERDGGAADELAPRRGRGTRPVGRNNPRGEAQEEAQTVRAWAKAQGIEVGEKGRVPAAVRAEYREAGSPQGPFKEKKQEAKATPAKAGKASAGPVTFKTA